MTPRNNQLMTAFNMPPVVLNDSNGLRLLTQLAQNNDVFIKQGKLVILPHDLTVPVTLLAKQEPIIIQAIIELLNIDAFQYTGYSTGSYESSKYQGITLQFINVLAGANAYVIFNANLKRERTTKHGKKGELLPNGKFTVSKSSKFYKFWLSTGVVLPKRLASFYDCMGKLKPLLFTGKTDSNGRFLDKNIALVCVDSEQIIQKLTGGLSGKTPDNSLTTSRQTPDNSLTRMPDKHFNTDQARKGVQPFPSTGAKKYVLSIQGSKVKEGITPVLNSIDKGINESVRAAKKQPEEQTVDEWIADWENAFMPEEFNEVMTDFSKRVN